MLVDEELRRGERRPAINILPSLMEIIGLLMEFFKLLCQFWSILFSYRIIVGMNFPLSLPLSLHNRYPYNNFILIHLVVLSRTEIQTNCAVKHSTLILFINVLRVSFR